MPHGLRQAPADSMHERSGSLGTCIKSPQSPSCTGCSSQAVWQWARLARGGARAAVGPWAGRRRLRGTQAGAQQAVERALALRRPAGSTYALAFHVTWVSLQACCPSRRRSLRPILSRGHQGCLHHTGGSSSCTATDPGLMAVKTHSTRMHVIILLTPWTSGTVDIDINSSTESRSAWGRARQVRTCASGDMAGAPSAAAAAASSRRRRCSAPSRSSFCVRPGARLAHADRP